MKNRTTLQVEKNTLDELKKCKRYPRETNGEVLKRLIKKEMAKKKIKAVLN